MFHNPILEDCCVLQEEVFCKSSEFWKAYEKWAEDNGEKPFGRRKFNNRLKVLGCEPGRKSGDLILGWNRIVMNFT